MDLTQLLAQLQALGPIGVTGQPGAYSSEALQRLMPGARIQARQSHGYLGGDAAGFYDDPSQGYDVFQTIGDGRYLRGGINPDGTFGDLREMRDSDNIFDKIGDFALDYGPALVLAAATYGAGGLGSLTGGAGAEAAGASMAPAVEGGMSMIPGAGASGIGSLLPASSLPMSSAATTSFMPGTFGASMAPVLAGTGSFAAPALAAASQPAVAPQSAAVAPASAAAAPAAAGGWLETAKTLAPFVGPAASLIQGATAQQPQMPQNAEARVPGVEAPPEARGLQAARAPILDVLGRNRRNNRNGTMLTGPGGVNMESVRVGGTTLLGL